MREEGLATSQPSDALEQLFDRMSENEYVAPEVWERSAAVSESSRYVAYFYMEHVSVALSNNALCTENIN